MPSEGQPDTGDVALEMIDKATPLVGFSVQSRK